MPKLPLPRGSVRLDAGPLPVSSTADVLACWSGDLSATPVAPVRDAIVDGQFAGQIAYQDATAYAAAQSDPTRATGEYLDEIGSFERGIQRGNGESDTFYRPRVNTPPTPVDPEDIVAAATAALAPFTSVPCFYAERSDGFFPGDTNVTVYSAHAFADPRSALYTSADGGAGATPNYPDRAYGAIAGRRPPGIVACGYGDGPRAWTIVSSPTPLQALAGTAAATVGSVDIIGTSTHWTSLQVGQPLYVTSGSAFAVVTIASIVSDTHIQIAIPWQGKTVSGLALSTVALLPQAQCDAYGRWFLLRVPDISAIDSTVAAAYQLGINAGPFQPPGNIVNLLNNSGLFQVNTDIALPADVDVSPVAVWGTNTSLDGVDGVRRVVIGQDGTFTHTVLNFTYSSGWVSGGQMQIGLDALPETPAAGGGLFPGATADGTAAFSGVYLYDFNQTSLGAYQSAADSVEALRGHGIRWSMISDPYLTA